MIAWTPALAVGIEEIDAQHQELFRRADRFVASLDASSRQDVGIVLSYLRLYCVTHFGAEEAWMREAGYPDYEAHKAEHDGFVEELLEMSAEHERRKGPGLQPMRVGGFIRSWLENHVSGTDRKLARFLLAQSA
ncbi:bacteriohemerythrin [Anaeromyxobacter oryzae]|uniref:Hemerythrin n=1 Tax=Anaeromyxobacter oryzae TaxID=2918170 RepID=A0ABM7WWM5_9BACT|nr:bacteriohemerythrin [Anaeromyxobacter oryzae]BDG03900.1 hemerythrin [Anaeromyxobacter oryzae]